MNKLKIWTKKELLKGSILSDKITYRGVRFEIFSLSNFDKEHLNHLKIKRMVDNFRREGNINQLIEYIKFFIFLSPLYKKMQSEGYHTHIYLNVNFEGVDCYLSR